MPTLRELAEQLGVSIATVSRALNDKPGVSEATRQRVLQLASELHYRPNQAARNLSTSRMHTVVFMIHRRQFPTTRDPFYPFILQGMEEVLSAEGYAVPLITLDEGQLASGPETVRALQEHRADAIVLAGPDIPPRFILATSQLGLPTLLVDNALSETAFPSVMADNKGGCQAVTRHLIEEHGHRNIALLRGPRGWVSNDERAAGYLAAMEGAGLHPQIFWTHDTTIETGRAAAEEALAADPHLSAVVAVNDAMAIGAIRCARAHGRRVPADLAVVGFDDISWAVYAEPPLTTVRVPKVEMGRLAARLLLERLQGAITAHLRTTVTTQLVLRLSCGCPGP